MSEGQRGSPSACTGDIHSSLVQARDIIVQLLNGVTSLPQTDDRANAGLPRPSESTQSPQTQGGMNIHNVNGHERVQNRAIEEHRRLFGFYPHSHSVGSGTQSSGGKRSRNKGKDGKSKKAKCATWTHAFVCLRKKSQFCLPFPQERYELKCTGLGEKKITIEVENKDFDELYRVLLNEFPLLSHAGGIDLMRTGFGANSKTLEVVPVPHGSTTYTIAYLKDVLQQAKCYVRPIQRDLPKPAINNNSDITDEATSVSIVISLFNNH